MSSQTPLCALSSTGSQTLFHSRFLEIVNRLSHPLPPLSGHSFRRGFVVQAQSRGHSHQSVFMQHGEWKSLHVALLYASGALIPNPPWRRTSEVARVRNE